MSFSALNVSKRPNIINISSNRWRFKNLNQPSSRKIKWKYSNRNNFLSLRKFKKIFFNGSRTRHLLSFKDGLIQDFSKWKLPKNPKKYENYVPSHTIYFKKWWKFSNRNNFLSLRKFKKIISNGSRTRHLLFVKIGLTQDFSKQKITKKICFRTYMLISAFK